MILDPIHPCDEWDFRFFPPLLPNIMERERGVDYEESVQHDAFGLYVLGSGSGPGQRRCRRNDHLYTGGQRIGTDGISGIHAGRKPDQYRFRDCGIFMCKCLDNSRNKPQKTIKNVIFYGISG